MTSRPDTQPPLPTLWILEMSSLWRKPSVMGNNKREMPKPVQEDQWSKTWIRDELDDLGGAESYIWRCCVRDPIGIAMADCINDPAKEFYIDFSYGDSLPGPQMTRREMEDLFKPINLPDDEDSRDFFSLVEELSEDIWHFYTNETEGFKYFRFRAVAAPVGELFEILDEGWMED